MEEGNEVWKKEEVGERDHGGRKGGMEERVGGVRETMEEGMVGESKTRNLGPLWLD